MMPVVISAQTSGTLRSAVEERKKPVKPIKEPKMELRKMVPIKGVQWALC